MREKATDSSRAKLKMANIWEDKRRSPRVKLLAPIRYRVRGQPHSCNVLAENISLGGLGFLDEQFIPPQTTLMLEVNILSQVLNLIGRVTWSSPFSHSDKYHSGVEFVEIDSPQKTYLSDYIAMRLGQKIG